MLRHISRAWRTERIFFLCLVESEARGDPLSSLLVDVQAPAYGCARSHRSRGKAVVARRGVMCWTSINPAWHT